MREQINKFQHGPLKLLVLILMVMSMSAQQAPVQPMFQIPPSPMASSLGKYAEYPVSLNTGTVNISIPLYTIKSKSLQLPISLSYHSSGIKVNDEATDVGLGWSLNAGGVINRTLNGAPDEYGYFGDVVQADTLEYFGNPYRLLNDPDWIYTGPDPVRHAQILSFFVREHFLDPDELARKQYLDKVIRFKTEDVEPDKFSYNFQGKTGFFMYGNDGNIYTSDRAPIKVDLDINRQQGNDLIEIVAEDGTLYRFGKDLDGNEAFEETVTNTNTVPNITSFINIDYVSSWYLTEIISADKLDTISLKYISYAEPKIFKTQQFSITKDKELLDSDVPLYPIDCQNIENEQVSITRHTKYIDEIHFKNGKVKFNRAQDRQDTGGQYRLTGLDIYRHEENDVYTRLEQIELDNNHYFQRDNSGLSGTYTASELKSLKLEKVLFKDDNGLIKEDYELAYNAGNLPPRNCFAQDYWGYYNGKKQNTSLVPQATSQYAPDCFGPTSEVDRDPSALYMKASILESIRYPTGGTVKFEYEPHFIKGTTTQSQVESFTQGAIAYGTDPALPTIEHTPYTEQEFTYPYGAFSDTRITYEVSGFSRNFGYTGINYIRLIDVTDNNKTIYEVKHNGPEEQGGNNVIKSGGTNISLEHGHTYKVQAYVGDSRLKPGDMSIIGTSYASVTVSWKKVTNTQNLISKPIGGLRAKSIKYFSDGIQTKPSFMKRYDYGTESFQGHGVGRLLFDHTNNVTRKILLIDNFYDYEVYHSEPVDIQTNMGSAVEYDVVTEYYSDVDEFKTVYNYYPSNAMFSGLPIRNSPYPNTVRLYYPAWQQGVMGSVKMYSYNSGAYKLVSQDSYQYLELGKKTIKALKAQIVSRNENETTLGIVAFNYDILLGKKALVKKTSTTYDSNENLIASKVTDYGYEPNFFLQESVTTNTSESDETLKTSYVFPHTISNPSNVEIQLESSHRLLPPLETYNYRIVGSNENQLGKQKVSYKNWGPNTQGTADIISLEKVQSVKGLGQLKDEIVYHEYDDLGNPIEVSKADGPHTYYVWGYNGQYPIAKIENIQTEDISPGIQALIDAAMVASEGDDDTCLISESCSENMLRDALADLREALPGKAMMTSYTYDPLIGTTSITDERGNVKYYGYDGFNRLNSIKGSDEKMVQDYQYHYSTQNQ